MHHTTVAFHDSLVIELVHQHHVEPEIPGDTLLNLEVEILVIHLFAPFPKSRSIAVGAGRRIAVSVLFDGMHVGIVEFDECAVFTAKKCLAFEIVTGIQLVGPFALRVCSVGIEGCQGIGVFHGEGWQVVDER